MTQTLRTWMLPALLVGGAVAVNSTADAAPPKTAVKRPPTAVEKAPQKTPKRPKPPAAYRKLKRLEKKAPKPKIPHFTFRVPVQMQKIYDIEHTGKPSVQCIVWDFSWAEVQANFATHELGRNGWKTEDPGWLDAYKGYYSHRLGTNEVRVPIDDAGSFKGTLVVEVNALPTKDPTDAKSWSCQLIFGYYHPLGDGTCASGCSNDLKAAPGSKLVWRYGADI